MPSNKARLKPVKMKPQKMWALVRPDGSVVKVYETRAEARDVTSFYSGISDWYVPRLVPVLITEAKKRK